ncbi:MAG: hypothetical protein UIB39_00875 [Lachnospiraceae bacterium]|nr:hypothetical protein [Lachnospiraceae bacterium]
MDTVSGINTTNDKTIILKYEINTEDPVIIIATIYDYGTLTVVIHAGDEDITLLMTKQEEPVQQAGIFRARGQIGSDAFRRIRGCHI